MVTRALITLTTAGLCLAARPVPVSTASMVSARTAVPELAVVPPASASSTTDLAELARQDPLGLLAVAIRRYDTEVEGYTATLYKQERVRGRLHEPELIELAVRDRPYAVRMIWKQGAREVLFAKVEGVLFAAGMNGGKIKVWRPTAFLPLADSGTADSAARNASRYSITEAGLASALRRTYRAWSAAADAGTLRCEYLGTRPVEEVGGRVCHLIRRTCVEPEVDPFLMTEPRPDATKYPEDAFTTVEVMFDADTGWQIGSKLTRADGSLVGAYYFRNIVVNPPFPADSFTPAAFRK